MRRRVAIILVLAVQLALPSAAIAQVTTSAEAQVQAWREAVANFQATNPLPSTASVVEQLRRRALVDQFMRRRMIELTWELPVEQQRLASNAIGQQMVALDRDNAQWLKANLPPDGWFRINRDGLKATDDAFLILQHSNPEWREQMLPVIERFYNEGEVQGSHYALLYDRVQIYRNLPQRFGSQGQCIEGRISLSPIEDPEGVDERRAALKLSPLEEYKRLLGVGTPC